MSGESSQGVAPGATNWRLVALTAGLVTLSALEYWLIVTWQGVAPHDKVTAVLAIIGAYGIGLSFFRKSDVFGPVGKELIADLTSPNAALCWGTNFTFLGIVSNLIAIGLSNRRSRPQPAVLALLSALALVGMALGIFAYAVFHALIVVPIAYPAILVAAAVVNAFDTAAGDSLLSVTDAKGGPSTEMSLKAIVLNDKAASAAFIMGLPATVLALVGRIVTPLFS